MELDGFNTIRIYLFDESVLTIDYVDVHSNVVVYMYSPKCEVKVLENDGKVKMFTKRLTIMKQPRNILCDKSAATVFYKAEGGKNVQEPLPEKDNEFILVFFSPLVPTLAPFTKEDPEFVALLDNAYEHIANQKDFLTFF